MERSNSRRRTPWEGTTDLNATQVFLKEHYIANYKKRRQKIDNCDEADMVNSYPFRDIDISDIPELTEEQLKKMQPRNPKYFKPVKKAVQIRLDADVLAWFKGFGKGYQTRINAVLREVMLKHIE
jgi:uncharacterized protein (DUF4415 family)